LLRYQVSLKLGPHQLVEQYKYTLINPLEVCQLLILAVSLKHIL